MNIMTIGTKNDESINRIQEIIGCWHNICVTLIIDDLNNLSFEKLEALFYIHKPEVVICNAHCISVQNIHLLTEYCNNKNIKLICLLFDFTLDSNLLENGFNIRKEKIISQFQKQDAVLNIERNAVFRTSTVYGDNQGDKENNFIHSLLEKISGEDVLFVDNTNVFYPVLMDDLAFYINENLSKSGYFEIVSDTPITLFQMAGVVMEVFGESKDNLRPNTADSIYTFDVNCINPGISPLKKGIEIIRNQIFCSFNLVYKYSPHEYFMKKNIAFFRYEMGKSLALAVSPDIKERIDYVMPIPHSGIYYAIGIAEALNKPFIQGLEKKSRSEKSFFIADSLRRRRSIFNNMIFIKEFISGKSLCIVDEAVFTGVTLKSVCAKLREYNVKEIHICIPSPISDNSCESFIQPKRSLLLGYTRPESLKNYFDADSIIFQPIDIFKEAMGSIHHNLCLHCFGDKGEEL
ncbi:MAG: sugar nucleotide-binding protein [Treponema sp.]|nr:sugar nucleotide-binding protein [Treponema sp.]